jgi:hypothetical protein
LGIREEIGDREGIGEEIRDWEEILEKEIISCAIGHIEHSSCQNDQRYPNPDLSSIIERWSKRGNTFAD